MLTKTFSLKVIQSVVLSIDTYEQDIISVGNENKKITVKKGNNCNNMPILSLLGANHRLPLFHMDKCFIWLNKAKKTY